MEYFDYEQMLVEVELKLDQLISNLINQPNAVRNPRTEEHVRTYALAREYLKDKVKRKIFEELCIVNQEMVKTEVENEG